ncbi:LysM peptidoglycan-binding domain-containing protein [Streptomyces atriruber]|uniref:LysM peptidoglycan-binding domain-containing protein n=1 Tax=Streptomyces atriruber TaxID=545121 RepID=UPI0006E2CCBD|nr:Gmad2 immunoglobulin-like domain-containing protein [Streptomyces atriruber]
MSNRIDQPRKLDLVGTPVLIAGVGTGHEATLHYRVSDGHEEVTGHFNAGGGAGEVGQFQVQANVGRTSFKTDQLLVQVFEKSPKDGSEINVMTVPVLYGPRIVTGYHGYREHKVVKGDTLSGLAKTYYGDVSLYKRIQRANLDQISDPDKITPGQVLRVPMGS